MMLLTACFVSFAADYFVSSPDPEISLLILPVVSMKMEIK
jgi:hypothetical protein